MRRGSVDTFETAVEGHMRDFRKNHIRIAIQELERERRRDPKWVRASRVVDNRPGRPLEAVKLFGKIEWRAESLQEAVDMIWRLLVQRAEKIRLMGNYRKSLRVFYPQTGASLDAPGILPPGVDVVHFYPLVPYARRIEMGKSDKAPRGIFKRTATQVRSGLKGAVNVRFDYTVPQAPDARSFLRTNSRGRKRRTGALTGYSTPIPVPRIVLTRAAFFR